MHRFFIPPNTIIDGRIVFPHEVAGQLIRVLRARKGDQVVVLDNSGSEYLVELTHIEGNRIQGLVKEKNKGKGEPCVRLTLYQAILKEDKFDFVLQKGTELGVSTFVPFTCSYSGSNFPSPNKVKRWNRIVKEAAEQSRRPRLPNIQLAVDFVSACKEAKLPGIIPWEKEKNVGLSKFLDQQKHPATSFSIFIGPEGGFSRKEVEIAQSMGIQPITLGDRILRAETASLAVISAIMYEGGQFEIQYVP